MADKKTKRKSSPAMKAHQARFARARKVCVLDGIKPFTKAFGECMSEQMSGGLSGVKGKPKRKKFTK